MSATAAQAWIAVVGGLITAAVGVLGFQRSRARRDYVATVVVFGFGQVAIKNGVQCPETDEERAAPRYLSSPWLQIEAGLAVAANLPLLVLAEAGVREGVFDRRSWSSNVLGRELTCAPVPGAIDEIVATMMAGRHKGLRGAASAEHGAFHETRLRVENELHWG